MRRSLRPNLRLLQMFPIASPLEYSTETLVGPKVSPRLIRPRTSLRRGHFSGTADFFFIVLCILSAHMKSAHC